MCQPPITVDPSTFLLDAALMLRAGAVRHLLVVEDGRLVGLLTDRDIQRCAPSRLVPISEEGYNAVFEGTTVSRVMTREPLTVARDAEHVGRARGPERSARGVDRVAEHASRHGFATSPGPPPRSALITDDFWWL